MTIKRLPHVAPLVTVLVALFIIALIAGCASRPQTVKLHEKEHLRSHEVAYLVGDRESLMLHAVDGRENPSGRQGFGSSWDGTYRVEVLPGKHTLTVSLYLRTTSNEIGNRLSTYERHYEISSLENVNLVVQVEVGHTYLLTSEWDFDSQEWFPLVIDQTAKETVVRKGPYAFKRFQVGEFFESPGSALRR
jgi:hypothetical protein